jgi:hypothetical protein
VAKQDGSAHALERLVCERREQQTATAVIDAARDGDDKESII